MQAGTWPNLGESAQANQVDRATLTAALIKARERWLKNPAFTELRQQLDTLLRSQGQVMSAHEMRHGPAGTARLRSAGRRRARCARPPPCCVPRSRPNRTSTSRDSRPSTISPAR